MDLTSTEILDLYLYGERFSVSPEPEWPQMSFKDSVMAAVGTQLRTSNGAPPSRLSMMQAKFQEKLMLEKESRLLEMAARQDAEREDIISRVTRTSNSLSSSMSSLGSSGAGQGRVRRMFEERRGNHRQSPKGYDKSYPLDPVRRGEGSRLPPRGGRGGSVDRAQTFSGDAPMNRSRSYAGFQRANRGDNRLQRPPKGPPPLNRAFPSHHKSASSLIEGNTNPPAVNGHSRGPSPAPPSSTKSSPGPRGPPPPPVTPPRKPTQKKGPPPRKENNFLTVSGSVESRSRSPTPTPRDPPSESGFLSKLGIRSKKPAGGGASTPKPKPPPTKSKLSVNSRSGFGGASGATTPRSNPPPKSPVPDNLRSCKLCQRNFAPDRIQKHEEICAKTKAKAKKRKVFDPVKMRTKGTEAEKFVARGDHLKETKKTKKNNWRKKHEDFIKTVRAAKGVSGYEAPPIDTSDYVDCPHCGRKFSEKVADRHIPKCADITSNKNNRRIDQRGPPQKAPVKAPPRRRR